MIRALGIGPAVSIVGAVAAVLILPVPFLFMEVWPKAGTIEVAPEDS